MLVSRAMRTLPRVLGARARTVGRLPQRSAKFVAAIQTPVVTPVFRTLRMSAAALDDLTVNLPPLAESISEGEVGSIEVGTGDWVNADDVVINVETDKLTVAVNAPESGTIKEILVEEGDTIGLGHPLFVMETGGEAPAAAEKPAPTPAAPAAEPSVPAPKPIAPTPPPAAPTAPASPPPSDGTPASDVPGVTRVKMSKIRQTVARRLKESQETAAFLTTFNEIDMSNLMSMRTKYKDEFLKKHDVKLGFMGAFAKAVTHAAKAEPAVNAAIDGKDILYHDFVNISVAVAGPKGLVTPVIKGCDTKSIAEIERALGEAAQKARDGKLAMEDFDGGTITISNGGTFGSLMGTPIINPPQSAVLGMHGIFERPVAIDGEVVVRPMMYVALTYDHRLIDGKEAVLFLRKVKEGIEDPLWMIMG